MQQRKPIKNNINITKMKKIYDCPQILFADLAPVEIIATSGGTVNHVAKHVGQHLVHHLIKGMFGG